jgi:hypothetical protein
LQCILQSQEISVECHPKSVFCHSFSTKVFFNSFHLWGNEKRNLQFVWWVKIIVIKVWKTV